MVARVSERGTSVDPWMSQNDLESKERSDPAPSAIRKSKRYDNSLIRDKYGHFCDPPGRKSSSYPGVSTRYTRGDTLATFLDPPGREVSTV